MKKIKIGFLIEEKDLKLIPDTFESIQNLTKNKKYEIIVLTEITEDTEVDYVVKLPNDGILMENFIDIIDKYIEDDTILLPLVILKSDKMDGILNSCLWNLSLTPTPGELDFELAQKQIDLTLFGALIPKNIYLDKDNYKEDLPIYQDFYFLNKITKKEIKVIGIPKTLLITNIDLFHSEYNNEEKVKFFKEAKKVASEVLKIV